MSKGTTIVSQDIQTAKRKGSLMDLLLLVIIVLIVLSLAGGVFLNPLALLLLIVVALLFVGPYRGRGARL
jgi:hypothetical protein